MIFTFLDTNFTLSNDNIWKLLQVEDYLHTIRSHCPFVTHYHKFVFFRVTISSATHLVLLLGDRDDVNWQDGGRFDRCPRLPLLCRSDAPPDMWETLRQKAKQKPSEFCPIRHKTNPYNEANTDDYAIPFLDNTFFFSLTQ